MGAGGPSFHLPLTRGRPPSFPFFLAAATFARLRDAPPTLPSPDAIHFLLPVNPCNNAGRYKSASSFGKWIPYPEGVISISPNSAALAPVSPCALSGKNPTSSPELSPITTRPVLRSYRAVTALGTFACSSRAR